MTNFLYLSGHLPALPNDSLAIPVGSSISSTEWLTCSTCRVIYQQLYRMTYLQYRSRHLSALQNDLLAVPIESSISSTEWLTCSTYRVIYQLYRMTYINVLAVLSGNITALQNDILAIPVGSSTSCCDVWGRIQIVEAINTNMDTSWKTVIYKKNIYAFYLIFVSICWIQWYKINCLHMALQC